MRINGNVGSRIMLACLLASVGTTSAADAVSDELIPAPPIVTLEFSPDGRHISWVERGRPQAPLTLPVFYAPLEADGTLDFAKATDVSATACAIPPQDCDGPASCICGDSDFRGTPQWGQVALRAGDPEGTSNQIAVYLREDTGEFVFLRADGADGTEGDPDFAPDEVRFVRDDCDDLDARQTPYPIRSAFSPRKWMVYTVEFEETPERFCRNRPAGAEPATCLALMAVDLDSTRGCPHRVVYDEYRFPLPDRPQQPQQHPLRAPSDWGQLQNGTSLQLGWFRWGIDTSSLFYGATFPKYSAVASPPDGFTPTTVMRRVDFANGFDDVIVSDNGQRPARFSALDTFPVGDEYLVLGLFDKSELFATDVSRVYRNGGGAEFGGYERLFQFRWKAGDETQIAAGNAHSAQSYEGFRWNGAQYVTYVLLDSLGEERPGRTQWEYPGEIWVQKLNDPTVNCVVNAQTAPTARFEPEPIIAHDEQGNEIVRIYYNESTPDANPWRLDYRLRLITLADQTEFDARCRLGDVWDD